MKVAETAIPGVLLIEMGHVFSDDRGMFAETYQKQRYQSMGVSADFVQDNRSISNRGVLRGLHYQVKKPIGHLVHVTRGRIFDVGVDLRADSPTFGQHVSFLLSADEPRQVFLPPGVAHGFCALDDENELLYKCTEYYYPDEEGGVVWNDPDLGIDWPLTAPDIKQRDREYPRLKDIPRSRLPDLSGLG